MVMIAFGYLIRPLPSRFNRRLRGLFRNQAVTARADQFRPAGREQRLAHLEVILGLEELKKSSLHLAIAQMLRDVDLFTRERVKTGVVHASRDIKRSGDKI